MLGGVPVIRLNGEPVSWRPFTEDELAPLRKHKDAAFRSFEKRKAEGKSNAGMWLNLKKQFHAFLLVEPAPGDNITADGLPEDYEEVWVRFRVKGTTMHGNMRIAP